MKSSQNFHSGLIDFTLEVIDVRIVSYHGSSEIDIPL
jgi:hypothetical protein